MAGTKRKYSASYKRSSVKKAKFKSAKSVYKLQRHKPTGSKSKSRRKWLLKSSRKGRLSGSFKPKSLAGKDVFHPSNEQGSTVSINKQFSSGPIPLNPALASQQLVMCRKFTGHHYTPAGKQGCVNYCHIQNAVYDPAVTPDPGAHIPNMWNIAMKTAVNGGSYYSVTAPSAMTPTLEFMRRQKLYLKSYRANFTIVNPTNADVTMTINQVRQRQNESDSTMTPLAVWNQASLNNDNQDSDVGTITGFAPFNDSDNYWIVGNKPTQNKQYNAKYGTSHSRTVKLTPGQIYNYTVHIKYNKYLHWEDAYPTLPGSGPQGETNSVRWFLQNFTQFTQFIFHGQPAEDNTSSSMVTYAPATFNVFCSETTKFYMCPLRPVSNYMLNEVPNASINQATLRTVQADGDFVVPQEVLPTPLFAQAAGFATSNVASTGNQIYQTSENEMTA